jgi:hypothetical protein
VKAIGHQEEVERQLPSHLRVGPWHPTHSHPWWLSQYETQHTRNKGCTPLKSRAGVLCTVQYGGDIHRYHGHVPLERKWWYASMLHSIIEGAMWNNGWKPEWFNKRWPLLGNGLVTHFRSNESTHDNRENVGRSVFCAVCAEAIWWEQTGNISESEVKLGSQQSWASLLAVTT